MDAGPTRAAPPLILHGRGMAMWRGPLPYRKWLSCRVQTLSRVHTAARETYDTNKAHGKHIFCRVPYSNTHSKHKAHDK